MIRFNGAFLYPGFPGRPTVRQSLVTDQVLKIADLLPQQVELSR
jgi:hypothetical protein